MRRRDQIDKDLYFYKDKLSKIEHIIIDLENMYQFNMNEIREFTLNLNEISEKVKVLVRGNPF